MKVGHHLDVVRIALSATALAIVLLSSTALAQSASPGASGSTAQTSDSDEATLTEVLVTAERREEHAQDVPITISDVSAERLVENNVQSVSDLQYVVPGFRLDEDDGLFQPTIRGVSTSIGCTGCGTDIGVYLDGFFDPHGLGINLAMFNVSDVQVLKGPQGTLFGRNTVGGAVLVNHPDPSSDTKGFVEASYGSYNAQEYQAYFTTGLTDKIAIDIGGYLSGGDGYITDILTDNHKYGRYENGDFRTSLKFDVTDDLSFLLRYEHISLDDPSGLLFDAFLLNGKPLAFGDYLPGAVVAAQRGQVATPFQVFSDSSLDSYQLTGTWDLGFATLKSYSQYRHENSIQGGNYALSSADLLHLSLPDLTKTITQELLLSSKPGGPLQWTGGVYYYDSRDSYQNIEEAINGPYTLLGTTTDGDRSIAAYGDVTYQFLDQFFFTGGARYNRDYQVGAGWTLPTSGQTVLPTLESTKVTPRAVLRYKVNDASSAYLSFSQGYKAGIYNTGAFSAVPVKAENITAYEVGYKYAGPRVSVDLSSFYYNYTNQQLTSDIYVNGNDESNITNAATSHMYGADVDMRFQVTRDFRLNVGGEYLHARYLSFPNAPGFTITPNHLLVTAILNAGGDQMARSPPVTANVGGTYAVGLPIGKILFSANFYYSDAFYWDYANQLPQKAYETVGLRAAWTDPTGRYELAVSGDNVTNAHYYTAENQDIYEAGGIWAAPPTVKGSFRIHF